MRYWRRWRGGSEPDQSPFIDVLCHEYLPCRRQSGGWDCDTAVAENAFRTSVAFCGSKEILQLFAEPGIDP
jgi:hypothetical protein